MIGRIGPETVPAEMEEHRVSGANFAMRRFECHDPIDANSVVRAAIAGIDLRHAAEEGFEADGVDGGGALEEMQGCIEMRACVFAHAKGMVAGEIATIIALDDFLAEERMCRPDGNGGR